MREQLLPSIQKLTQVADELSRLYTLTGDAEYLRIYEQVTSLILDVKSRVKRREND